MAQPPEFPKAKTYLDNYFRVSRLGSNYTTEIISGFATYLSLSYIFIVNPAILHSTGVPLNAAIFASIAVSGLATLLMGGWARLPFAIAPGLEMNGFFAFVMCAPGPLGLTWQEGLSCVFWAGILCLFVGILLRTSRKAVHRIVDAAPHGLELGITMSVGIFVAATGLFIAHIVSSTGHFINFSGWTYHTLLSHEAILLYIGLFLCILFDWYADLPGGVLVSILITTLFSRSFHFITPQEFALPTLQ